MLLCYTDGKFVEPSKAVLPVSDMIIQRGIGVFEVIGTFEGRPIMLDKHIERLMSGAENMRIHPRYTAEHMSEIILEGLRKSGEDVQAKAYITGGDVFIAESGIFAEPRFFVIFERQNTPSKEMYLNGVALEPVNIGRDSPSVKSIDYRSSYVQNRQSKRGSCSSDAFEVLYCPDGRITEAGHSSFFLVSDGAIVTAPLSCVLNGTTRGVIIELARREGICVTERCPLLSELSAAQEAFITGSVKRILPVTRIGDKVIGDGRPGLLTQRLSALYEEYLRT